MKVTVNIPDLTTDGDTAAFCLWLECAIRSEGEHQVGQISWTE